MGGYTPINEVIKVDGLHPIKEYIQRMKNTVEDYVITKTILCTCLGTGKIKGGGGKGRRLQELLVNKYRMISSEDYTDTLLVFNQAKIICNQTQIF